MPASVVRCDAPKGRPWPTKVPDEFVRFLAAQERVRVLTELLMDARLRMKRREAPDA